MEIKLFPFSLLYVLFTWLVRWLHSSSFLSSQASLQATSQVCSFCPVSARIWHSHTRATWTGHPLPCTVPTWANRRCSLRCPLYLQWPVLAHPVDCTFPPSLSLKSHLKYNLHPDTFPSKLPAGCELSSVCMGLYYSQWALRLVMDILSPVFGTVPGL